MKRAAEYRTRARCSLSGRYGTMIAAQFISGMIISTAIFVLVFGIIFAVLGLNLSASSRYSGGTPFYVIFLSITMAALFFLVLIAQVLLNCGMLKLACRAWKQEPATLGDMFYGFKGSAPLRIIGISFLIGLMEFAFMIPYQICVFVNALQRENSPIIVVLLILTYLLAIVGSMLISLFFGLSLYVLLDMPELGAVQCMKASFRLTKGRRFKLFCLYLSFFGWGILGMMSFGIGMLWITPYIYCTIFHFYEDLKLEKGQMQGTQPV